MTRRYGMRRFFREPLSGPCLCGIICLLLLLPLAAQAADPLEGRWEGSLDVEGQSLPLTLVLQQETGGAWQGHLESPAAAGEQTPLQALSVSGTAFSFRFDYQSPPISATVYASGNYRPWDDTLKGTFVAQGRSMPVRFQRFVPSAAADSTLAAEEVHRGFDRHPSFFAVFAHGVYSVPLYILKERRRNINDVATSSFGWNAGLQLYLLDGWGFFARYSDSGLKFKSDQSELAPFESIGLTDDAFLELKAYEFGTKVYLGNAVLGTSKFNPYLLGLGEYVQWSLDGHGRGSTPIEIMEEPVKGEDFGFGAGLGTEYPLMSHLVLEVEWVWRYILTEDATVWPNPEDLWTNTHVWDLSLGLILNF